MWTTRGLIVLMLGGLLAGCGQQQSGRGAVADYLKQVNTIEKQLARPLSQVTTTGSQFAQEQRSGGSLTSLLPASQAQTLSRAGSEIELLRSRLAGLSAPSAASHLRNLLLEVADGQAKLTRELAKLVVFLPGYARALRPLTPAMRRLELALSGQTATGSAASVAGKAGALHRFQASLQRILGQLRQLQAPAVSRPEYNGQIAALTGMRTAAGELAMALEGGAQADISQLLTRFDRAATSTETIAAQKARIAAARAYDGESSRLAQLSQEAEAERLRLANNLS